MDTEVWLTTGQVGNLLGITTRAVKKNCAAGKYLTRKVKSGKGGGNGGEVYEIALSSLPQEARKRHEKAHPNPSPQYQAGLVKGLEAQYSAEIETLKTDLSVAAGNREYLGLDSKAKARANAKADIVVAFGDYLQATGKTLRALVENKGLHPYLLGFVVAYNQGGIAGLDEARAVVPSLSVATLDRTIKKLAREGAAALAGKYGHRKGTGKIDSQPELKEYVLGSLAGQPHISAANLTQAIYAEFAGRADVALPDQRSIQRWVKDWKAQNAELYTAIANPDAWRNSYKVAYGDAKAGIERLNQVWEMDSTPGDVELQDGRHCIVGVIDLYSERAMVLVSKTSKATAIALLIRLAILAWGVPEQIKTDNGKDYDSNHIRRALRFLGIEQHLCPPFSPDRKPFIERFLGTMSHGPIEMLEGFIGHNVAERQAIRAQQSFADRIMTKGDVVPVRLTAAQLQDKLDRWVNGVYFVAPHSGLNHQSPQSMVLHYDGPVKAVADARALDLLLAEAPGDGYRTVTKKGLRIDNDAYIAPELESYAGKRVLVLYDPNDLGRVYVYAEEGGKTVFVAVAECPDRTGISRQEVAAKATAMQQERIREAKKALNKAKKKVKIGEALDKILDVAEQANNVVFLPRPAETHTTAALDAATEAADMAGLRTLDDLGEAEIIDLQSKKAAIEASGATREEPDFDTTFQRALWLWERAIKDEPMNGEQAEYLRDYRKLEPKSWRSLDNLLQAKWGERYLGIRDQRLGLKK